MGGKFAIVFMSENMELYPTLNFIRFKKKEKKSNHPFARQEDGRKLNSATYGPNRNTDDC